MGAETEEIVEHRAYNKIEKKKHTTKISEEKSYYLQTQTAVPSDLGAETEEIVEHRAYNKIA